MTHEVRILVERVITTQETHGAELSLMRKDLEGLRGEIVALGLKVEQHRTGWRIFMWLGGAGIAAATLFAAFWKS